jgi:hypothetical protein
MDATTFTKPRHAQGYSLSNDLEELKPRRPPDTSAYPELVAITDS